MSDSVCSVFPNENFVDLCPYQYGYEKCDSLHSYGPFIRNHYLFHYVISGAGTLEANDEHGVKRIYQIRSGQGFLICPKQVTVYCADKEHPWEYVWLEFDGLRVKEALDLAGLTVNAPVYRSGDRILSGNLRDTMLYIVQHAGETPFHLIGYCYLFFDLLTKSSAARKRPVNHSMRDFYMKESLSFIEQHFQEEITIEDIASCCNLNRSYFGKLFRESTGKSPQQFLIEYRMTKAAQLLKTTLLSVQDIGYAVGYTNQLHFSRAFKNTYQLSPKKWRETHSNIPLTITDQALPDSSPKSLPDA